MTISIIVDTDMAVDDWLALVYLTQCRDVNIRAVTIAATGEAHAGAGVQSALRILKLGSLDIPVTHGPTKPLRGDHHFPWFVRLIMDWRLLIAFPKTTRTQASLLSKDLLIQQIESSPEKITLLTLGPLTNIAEILLARPQLVDRIAMIYVMGGAITVAGNLTDMYPNSPNKYAECNLYIDPYAVDVVLSSGAPITLIPLDATNQVPVTDRFVVQFESEHGTDAADFAYRVILRMWRLAGKRAIYLWDAIAAVIATHPDIATFATVNLRMISDEGVESGRLVEDAAGSPVQVCTGVDQVAFERIFLTTLNGQ